MKTRTTTFAITKQVRLFCASILLLGASAVCADPAAVIDDFGCGAWIPDYDGSHLGWVTTTESHKVITDKGVRILTCHFDHEFDLAYATGDQGFLCGISGIPTSKSKMIATPGGKATLVCKINGNE